VADIFLRDRSSHRQEMSMIIQKYTATNSYRLSHKLATSARRCPQSQLGHLKVKMLPVLLPRAYWVYRIASNSWESSLCLSISHFLLEKATTAISPPPFPPLSPSSHTPRHTRTLIQTRAAFQRTVACLEFPSEQKLSDSSQIHLYTNLFLYR
jgi:hypothetical protein